MMTKKRLIKTNYAPIDWRWAWPPKSEAWPPGWPRKHCDAILDASVVCNLLAIRVFDRRGEDTSEFNQELLQVQAMREGLPLRIRESDSDSVWYESVLLPIATFDGGASGSTFLFDLDDSAGAMLHVTMYGYSDGPKVVIDANGKSLLRAG
jgi:hypothetical protein